MRVVSRYVLVEFLRIFGLCMVGFLLIYVLVDLFDRLQNFLKFHASLGEVCRYLFFKIPLIVTQLIPIATLASVLIALGTMARHNELTALRASGVSTVQIATPLFAIAVALSVLTVAWNETVVPYSTERSRYIEIVEIRNRPLKALLSEDGIWFHGRNGIYNIEHFDARTGTLVGLTVYDLSPGFVLQRLVEVPTAHAVVVLGTEPTRLYVWDLDDRRLLRVPDLDDALFGLAADREGNGVYAAGRGVVLHCVFERAAAGLRMRFAAARRSELREIGAIDLDPATGLLWMGNSAGGLYAIDTAKLPAPLHDGPLVPVPSG